MFITLTIVFDAIERGRAYTIGANKCVQKSAIAVTLLGTKIYKTKVVINTTNISKCFKFYV